MYGDFFFFSLVIYTQGGENRQSVSGKHIMMIWVMDMTKGIRDFLAFFLIVPRIQASNLYKWIGSELQTTHRNIIRTRLRETFPFIAACKIHSPTRDFELAFIPLTSRLCTYTMSIIQEKKGISCILSSSRKEYTKTKDIG